MAVIISNMRMPKNCEECIFTEHKSEYCLLIHDNVSAVKKTNMCPLKKVNDNTVLEDIKAEIVDYFQWGDVSSTDQNAILDIIDNQIRGKENYE